MTTPDAPESLSETFEFDRLSSLPNELLDHIFDLAHTLDHPSTGAISKHLLPFHISGLYRRIHLERATNLGKLIDKVSRERDYGERIRSLKIDHSLQGPISLDSFPWDDVGPFFQSLSRLEDLDLGEDQLDLLRVSLDEYLRDSGTMMRSLVTLRVRGQFPFWWFEAVPSLVKLEFLHFNYIPYAIHELRDPLKLPRLVSLSFTGVRAGDSSIASYFSLCPNLRHLSLHMKYVPANYGFLLSLLPTTLVSLELESDSQYRTDPCDDLLPRFTQLERLSLDKGIFTPQLPSHLASLSHLKELRLAEGIFSIDRFLALVSGPTRRRSFRKLTLDYDYELRSKIGYRLEVDEDGSIGSRWVPGEGRLAAGDWILPSFDFDDGVWNGFMSSRIRDLIRFARCHGIVIDGNFSHALGIADAFLLEVANLAVYRSFRDGDLRHIVDLQENYPHLCGGLPSLDLDALDQENLELVKTDLPDEGWFQLSLRNKESNEGHGDERERCNR
ncbi:hypothetical protein JCM11491_006080 [Sporobolomyces phaffii]